MSTDTDTVTRERPETDAESGRRRRREDERTETETRGRTDHRCPECDGELARDEERGERVCADCGLVVEADEIDRGPEWRAFDAADRDEKSRVGAPTTKTMHDEGLSTEIGWENTDAYGKALSGRKRRRIERMRTWDERFRTKDARERNLKQALGEIERMASALGLPENVRETASVIYRRALEEDLLPGRSIEAVATAALYAAARQAGTPRTLDELARVSRVDRREFERAYRYVVRELSLGVEPADPTDYLPRVVSDAGASDAAERRARELIEAGKQAAVHSGKSPMGLAAAAVYAGARLAGEELTQSEVSDAADVSEVTIRNRYKELLDAYERTADRPVPA